MAENERNPVIGIDLGTTFSAIARWDGRGPYVYQNKWGDYTTQSVVYYEREKHNGSEQDHYLVGKSAYQKTIMNPEQGIIGVKRYMDNASHQIMLGDKPHNPVEISSKILEKMHEDVASQYPPRWFRSRGVVVSVPYYFKAHQCKHTREAAEMAGLPLLGIIQEPIAASLAYALEMIGEPQRDGKSEGRELEENILVFDLGGGTFDLTLFRLIWKKEELLFEVLATGGDDRLGGLDFDNRLKDYVCQQHQIDLSALSPRMKKRSEQRLMEGITQLKESLAFSSSYLLAIPGIPNKNGPDLEATVRYEEFIECISDYVEKIRGIIEATAARAGIRLGEISRVIKVGGSSKIPVFTQMLGDMIGSDKVYGNVDPSLCVAQGAAVYAAHLDDPRVLGRELRIESRISHAIGVELMDGYFDKIVDLNTKLPCSKKRVYGLGKGGSTALDLNVYQGSSDKVKNNSYIGTISIGGLPPDPTIQVHFNVTKEQIIEVSISVPEANISKHTALQYT